MKFNILLLILLCNLIFLSITSRKLKTKSKTKHSSLFNLIVRNLDKCQCRETPASDLKSTDICVYTAFWIIDSIMLHGKQLNFTRRDDLNSKISKIKDLINGRFIVYIGIKKDHHFICYKDPNENYLDIYQSFRGGYNLNEWIEYYYDDQTAKLTVADFIRYLHQFMDNSKKKTSETKEATNKLFATNSDNGKVTPINWFSPKDKEIPDREFTSVASATFDSDVGGEFKDLRRCTDMKAKIAIHYGSSVGITHDSWSRRRMRIK